MDYLIVNKYNKRFITVPRLKEEGLKNCFTTIDMDIGTKTNNSIESIKSNLKIIYDFLDIRPKEQYHGLQTHSKNIEIIKENTRGEIGELGKFFHDTDGLITQVRDIVLYTKYADCIPILIFDPVKKIQANIHSGWKGTLQKIGIQALNRMKEKYKSKAGDLIIVLGPAIGKEDFEVDRDVMELFQTTFPFSDKIIKTNEKSKYLIDLKEIYKKLFIDEGIKIENIIDINLSTYTTPYLHSFRRDKEDFGLMGCFTSL